MLFNFRFCNSCIARNYSLYNNKSFDSYAHPSTRFKQRNTLNHFRSLFNIFSIKTPHIPVHVLWNTVLCINKKSHKRIFVKHLAETLYLVLNMNVMNK